MITLAVVAVVFPPTRWADLGQAGIAAAFSVLNWQLAAQSVDYQSSLNAATPLQHFWSLGVEEQFYLVWPLLVLGACALATRRGHGAITMVFGVVVVASLGFSVLEGLTQDPAAYFLTTTRAWELAIGGLIAALLPRIRLPRRIQAPLSILGLLTIAAAALLITGEAPFPGALALVPVLGAGAVIVAGNPGGRFTPGRLSGSRPVQRLGDISYSLYLWHFPPIVLFAVIAGHAPDAAGSILLGGGAVLIAWLSWRFIELPTRRSTWLAGRARRGLIMGATAIICAAAVAVSLPIAATRTEQTWVRAASQTTARGVEGAAAMSPAADRYFANGTRAMTPAPTVAHSDQETVIPADCMAAPKSTSTPVCVAGDRNGSIRVALVGDSHANMLAPVVVAIAKRRGWRVETHLHASCAFNLEERKLELRGGSICRGPNAETLRSLITDPPDIVFVANWASGDFVETDTGHAPGVCRICLDLESNRRSGK